MKSIKYLWLACLSAVALCFTACDDDDDKEDTTPITVSAVYLQDVESTVPNRQVDFVRLGQLVRIEGSGFKGLKKIYVNGYDTYFNNALMTDINVWVTINSSTPVETADDDVRNTIRFVKSGTETTISFTVRAASPSVSSISNTLPKAGETVVVNGSNLQETTKVTLPGGIEVTDIESDEDGEWYSFVMPDGVTEAGCILSEGANGQASSSACFNDFRCYITDWDGTGEQGSWSATFSADDLVDDPLGTGRGKCVKIIPDSYIEENGEVKGGVSSISGFWTAGNDNANDDWTRMTEFIDASTSTTNLAFQFDVYVPDEWDLTGQVEFTLQNNLSNYGYGSSNTGVNHDYPGYATVWVPWLNEDDGSHAAYKTDSWQTITIPLSEFGVYADEDVATTLQDVIDDRNNASYKNFGVLFSNADVEYSDDIIYEATATSQAIYLDNFRIVDNTSVTISDFDDEE